MLPRKRRKIEENIAEIIYEKMASIQESIPSPQSILNKTRECSAYTIMLERFAQDPCGTNFYINLPVGDSILTATVVEVLKHDLKKKGWKIVTLKEDYDFDGEAIGFKVALNIKK